MTGNIGKVSRIPRSSSKSFVQAWRELNAEELDVITYLLEEGTYEVRIYL